MTTFAPHHAVLDERVRHAWAAYRDSLADLHGRPYDDAERASWARLQETLRDIEDERALAEPDAEPLLGPGPSG